VEIRAGAHLPMTETQNLLKRMMVSAINAREVESNRVSRLLHDEVGQVLSAVGIQLHVLKLDYQQQLPEIVDRVHEIQKMLDSAVSQVRSLSYDLNPSVVDRAGLQLALERLVGRFRTASERNIRFAYDPSVRPPANISNAWYKIAELALDNAVRHADAEQIEVRVRAKGGNQLMEIRDDGRGFSLADVEGRTPGLGIMLMEHHASQAPIVLEFETAPGSGATIRCSFSASGQAERGAASETPDRSRRATGKQGNDRK
jgi:signal transduction histidine kinase